MRKALIGILLAATVAAPLYAAPSERGGRAARQDDDSARPARAERQAQRVERQEQRQQQRVERQAVRVERQQPAQSNQGQARQSWQGRGNRGGQAQQSWQGRGNAGQTQQTQQSWQGRSRGNPDREAYRRQIEESRAASAASARDGSPALQRRAAQNQARFEQRVREQRRDGRDGRDWNRDGRDRRDWSRNNNRGSWNRGWRNDNRYDWQRYRYSNRDIFRRGRYYAPFRNHHYNRLSIGLFLGSAFFGRNYWIDDPWYYRLPPAYPGTRWVRYYDDVLLIDVYTGEVIDVIYDFFW